MNLGKPKFKLIPGGTPAVKVVLPDEDRALNNYRNKLRKKARAHARRKAVYMCVCPVHGPMLPTASNDAKVAVNRKGTEAKRLRCQCPYTPVFKFQVDPHAKILG